MELGLEWLLSGLPSDFWGRTEEGHVLHGMGVASECAHRVTVARRGFCIERCNR